MHNISLHTVHTCVYEPTLLTRIRTAKHDYGLMQAHTAEINRKNEARSILWYTHSQVTYCRSKCVGSHNNTLDPDEYKKHGRRGDLSQSQLRLVPTGGGSGEPVPRSLSENKAAHPAKPLTAREHESASCSNSQARARLLQLEFSS